MHDLNNLHKIRQDKHMCKQIKFAYYELLPIILSTLQLSVVKTNFVFVHANATRPILVNKYLWLQHVVY